VNLTEQEATLVFDLQQGVPLEARPFHALARRHGVTEEDVVGLVCRLFADGQVRRFGAVFDARRLGYRSCLCAMRVPEAALACVAEQVCAVAGVTHAYVRGWPAELDPALPGGPGTGAADPAPNFWFTLAEQADLFDAYFEALCDAVRPHAVIALPATRRFKIDVVFDVRTRERDERVEPRPEAPSAVTVLHPDAADKALIRAMEGHVPVSAAPFAAVAAAVGMDESVVLERLRAWKASGVLRRVGLLLYHREAGFKANGMCCWDVPADQVAELGRRLASFPEVTHCYERPWHAVVPYRLFAMIHTGSWEETRLLYERLTREAGLPTGRVFFSLTEFKKTSMTFFCGWVMFDYETTMRADLALRCGRVRDGLRMQGAQAALLATPVNLLYLSGRVFAGQIYVPVEGETWFFVRRPSGLTGERVAQIRKPEDIPGLLAAAGVQMPERVLLEDDELSFAERTRLAGLFPGAVAGSVSAAMRQARAVKMPLEIAAMREGCRCHAAVYGRFAACYRPGMTDRDFAVAMEHETRQAGALGLFRVAGSSMEIFMGSVLAGDNAGAPSPYDFALGGAGTHPSLPVGGNGTVIAPGMTVMADIAGNFNGYLSDLTRVFARGPLPEQAVRLHRLAIAIQAELARALKPGAGCEALYQTALRLAAEGGGADCFMGGAQKAKFVGHGTGLVINELPVLGARSKDVLQAGMCIAIEPKFIVPGVGAVGVEDTFLVTENGGECLTACDPEIVML